MPRATARASTRTAAAMTADLEKRGVPTSGIAARAAAAAAAAGAKRGRSLGRSADRATAAAADGMDVDSDGEAAPPAKRMRALTRGASAGPPGAHGRCVPSRCVR
jgi:hypothetical protein